MSVHLPEEAALSHCSISETHSSTLSPIRSCKYQRKTQDFGRTYSKLSRQNAPSLHDAVVETELEKYDIGVDTLTEIDDVDSAYCSLEPEDGNLPQLDLLVEPDLLVIGHGINIDTLPYINLPTRSTRYVRHDKSVDLSDTDSSREKNQRFNVANEPIAHCSKIQNVDQVGSSIIKACERRVETESQFLDDVVGEDRSVTPDIACSTSSANATAEKSDESNDLSLWREFLTNTDDDYTYIATQIEYDTEQERQDNPLVAQPSDYFDTNLELENFDSNVGKAIEESVQSQSIAPLIKEELKCLIQCRRLQDGKPEIVIQPEEPKRYKLTEEEVKKKNTRLEQNRKSARKARQRMRGNQKVLEKYVDDAKKAQTKLIEMKNQLRQERDQIKDTVSCHLGVCEKHGLVEQHKEHLKYMYMTLI